MKLLYIIIITFLLSASGLYAETNIYHRTDFDRGEVVTVLITETEKSYSLELFNSSNQYITQNIFFPVNIDNFQGQAALIGLDSTLSSGEYTLRVKNQDGVTVEEGAIFIHQNLFKKENISLNYDNTSLRTDTDPEISRQAAAIHEIYETSDNKSVFSSNSFVSPLQDGIITSWYGDRRNFIYSDGKNSKSIHSGIDIAAPVGTEICAGSEGRIVLSSSRIITGNSIVIEYLPGVYGVFFHMDKIYVLPGDKVSKDTVIGTLGATGLATGPHLHWEFRVGGVPVNPEACLENGLIDNSLIMSIVSSYTAE